MYFDLSEYVYLSSSEVIHASGALVEQRPPSVWTSLPILTCVIHRNCPHLPWILQYQSPMHMSLLQRMGLGYTWKYRRSIEDMTEHSKGRYDSNSPSLQISQAEVRATTEALFRHNQADPFCKLRHRPIAL